MESAAAASVSGTSLQQGEEELIADIEKHQEKFEAAMEDDFNTADAVTAVFEIVRIANTNASSASSMLFLKEALDKITKLLNVLGIKALKQEELLAEEIEQLIQARQDARKEKNFARADEIRNLLLEKGIVLEDTREGVRWKRA